MSGDMTRLHAADPRPVLCPQQTSAGGGGVHGGRAAAVRRAVCRRPGHAAGAAGVHPQDARAGVRSGFSQRLRRAAGLRPQPHAMVRQIDERSMLNLVQMPRRSPQMLVLTTLVVIVCLRSSGSKRITMIQQNVVILFLWDILVILLPWDCCRGDASRMPHTT